MAFDKVEVVDQPFGRRRDRPRGLHAAHCHAKRLSEPIFIIREPGVQRYAACRPGMGCLRPGQAASVLFQPFNPEQLLAYGFVAKP